jgi:pimeloyl-ACP methyl ester carboxylesterase
VERAGWGEHSWGLGVVVVDMSRLLVYVPGLNAAPTAAAMSLLDRLRAEPGHADDRVWVYPERITRFSRGRLAGRARELGERIDLYWDGNGRADEIVLIGHSIGGLLLRYAYLVALGGFGDPPREWVRHVRRIVLLATPNRGVAISRLRWPLRWGVALLAALGHGFTLEDGIQGSPFLTNLRVEWIRQLARLGEPPLVVQIRGGHDRLVEREDSRDLEAMPTSAQIAVPRATHEDVMVVDDEPEDYPGERYDILRDAIIGTVEPTDPPALPPSEQAVTAVVFLLHGIRAGIGTWVTKLGGKLQRAGANVLVATPSYGYLSAYSFAIPFGHRRQLRWFADQYSYLLARHPTVPFHFVGHSNGTYLFGQSLRQIRALRFARVYLAGSVLPREFDWLTPDRNGQVNELVNVCATDDKPVGWLCSLLRGVGRRSIGTGGFDNFDVVPPASSQQLHSLHGGHGAALTDERLDAVAAYIQAGVRPTWDQPPNSELREPRPLFGLISRIAPFLAWLLLAGLGVAIWWVATGFSGLRLAALITALAFIAVALKVA